MFGNKRIYGTITTNVSGKRCVLDWSKQRKGPGISSRRLQAKFKCVGKQNYGGDLVWAEGSKENFKLFTYVDGKNGLYLGWR